MLFLVTGAAGFIGSQLVEGFLAQGHQVRGIDCFTDYYPRGLKEMNLAPAREQAGFDFWEQDLLQADLPGLLDGVDAAVHLAAQAGVRRSWGREFAEYTQNNVLATQRLLEAARQTGLGRLVYASSSSVYGDSLNMPTREDDPCLPVSPYGVTKLAGEHLCRLYHRNFGVNTVSLRFFTVYGPRQRPDMAFHRFFRAFLEGGNIRIFGDGQQSRDFTFVGDVVNACVRAARSLEGAGRVYNLGGGSRASINRVLEVIAGQTGGQADIQRQEVAKGDVRHTWADTSRLKAELGFTPSTGLEQGLAAQLEWMRQALPVLAQEVEAS